MTRFAATHGDCQRLLDALSPHARPHGRSRCSRPSGPRRARLCRRSPASPGPATNERVAAPSAMRELLWVGGSSTGSSRRTPSRKRWSSYAPCPAALGVDTHVFAITYPNGAHRKATRRAERNANGASMRPRHPRRGRGHRGTSPRTLRTSKALSRNPCGHSATFHSPRMPLRGKYSGRREGTSRCNPEVEANTCTDCSVRS